MYLKVEYLRDPTQPTSACWSFHPFVEDIEQAADLARDGLADVREFFGAKSYRVVDFAGVVVAQGSLPARYS